MIEETESNIQRSICDYLKFRRHMFWRSNNIPAPLKGGGFRRLPKHTPRGLPDIVVIKQGQFIGLEVKKPKGKQSPNQIEFEKNVTAAGGRYHVVHSIDEVQALGL